MPHRATSSSCWRRWFHTGCQSSPDAALFLRRAGTFAGYISVPDKLLARMPSALSFEQAASLPLVAITAYQAGISVLPNTCGSLYSERQLLSKRSCGSSTTCLL